MTIKPLIEACAKVLDEFKSSFAEYIKETSVPLEQRWSDFCLAVKRGVYHNVDSGGGYYQVLDNLSGFSWYDSLHIDRYQTVDLVDLIKMLEEELKANRIESLETKSLPTEQSQIDDLKEEILQDGYSHFILDW